MLKIRKGKVEKYWRSDRRVMYLYAPKWYTDATSLAGALSIQPDIIKRVISFLGDDTSGLFSHLYGN